MSRKSLKYVSSCSSMPCLFFLTTEKFLSSSATYKCDPFPMWYDSEGRRMKSSDPPGPFHRIVYCFCIVSGQIDGLTNVWTPEKNLWPPIQLDLVSQKLNTTGKVVTHKVPSLRLLLALVLWTRLTGQIVKKLMSPHLDEGGGELKTTWLLLFFPCTSKKELRLVKCQAQKAEKINQDRRHQWSTRPSPYSDQQFGSVFAIFIILGTDRQTDNMCKYTGHCHNRP